MLCEVYDRIIDLRRLRDVVDIPNQTQGSHTRMTGGMRLILEGLSSPMDIAINVQNPGQESRLAIARRQLNLAWRGIATTRSDAPRHVDDVYLWRGIVLDLAQVVVVTNVLRKEDFQFAKTRRTRPSLNVVLNYSVYTTGGAHVHGSGSFNPEEHIAMSGGMDFEHGKLLQAWSRFIERQGLRAA